MAGYVAAGILAASGREGPGALCVVSPLARVGGRHSGGVGLLGSNIKAVSEGEACSAWQSDGETASSAKYLMCLIFICKACSKAALVGSRPEAVLEGRESLSTRAPMSCHIRDCVEWMESPVRGYTTPRTPLPRSPSGRASWFP